MGPKAEELIREYGDQAYHMAVQLTMSTTLIGDVEGAEIFSPLRESFYRQVITSLRGKAMGNDSFGDRMKMYEMAEAGRKLMHRLPAIARLDGRSFSGFTRDMERPFDIRMSRLMIETTKYLVRETLSCGISNAGLVSGV